MANLRSLPALLLAMLAVALPAVSAQELPRLAHQGDRYSFVVDGKPYFILGAQVGNSSGWPEKLDALWPLAAAMHLNTLEVPVYWEQLEPREGQFDDTVVDAVLQQARAHHVRLVLLWFGTWKNGKMHYAPEWVKSDTARFPRMMTSAHQPIDVLSPNVPANLAADTKAFTHLMSHLRAADKQHTVIAMQVENESGSLGSVRDFSDSAQKQFNAAVPSTITSALHKAPGTWPQVFGDDADEAFAAYSTASYIDQVAAAGKKELALPMYVNNWLKSPRAYPVATIPGDDYPSGGPSANMLDMWKAAAPHIDILAPDIYVPGTEPYKGVMRSFHRADNPLFIPETNGFGTFLGATGTARNEFLAIGEGTIGFAPFGLDNVTLDRNGMPEDESAGFAENNRLLSTLSGTLAQLQFEGKIKTAVEEPGLSQVELVFGEWSALVSFPPAYDSGLPTDKLSASARLKMGRVLVASIGPEEFLVAGIDGRVSFRRTPPSHGAQTQLLRVEEGHYEGTTWKAGRMWNGDETDYGLTFTSPGAVLHVKLGKF